MRSNSVQIEYVQNMWPFPEGEEFVVLHNVGLEKYDLRGWRLYYEDISSSEELHVHIFERLVNGTLDPGERICVMSMVGVDRFVAANTEPVFPGPHWDIHTNIPHHLMRTADVRVRLVDAKGATLDSMCVRRNSDFGRYGELRLFIGHGRDPQWRELKEHLQDMHNIKVVSYEVGPRAGLSVKEVLQRMLEEAAFALLVLTGEDIRNDGEAHARENVIHELGLFQGKLGFTRAVILLEDGVTEFSNILGVNQIRFTKGRIRETFGDVVATLGREQH